MTIIEFILSVAVVSMVVLEIRNQRYTSALRESARRAWVRKEHEECN